MNVCEILNAIFCLLSTGCQWRALPKDPPPKRTAHDYLALWDWNAALERLHDAFYSPPANAKYAGELSAAIVDAPAWQ